MGWQMYIAIPLFMIAAICVLIAVVCGGPAHRKDLAAGWGTGAAAALIVASIFGFFSLTTMVGTRQIAIETRFGKPNGTSLPNGFHWKSPFTQTHEIDGAIQIDRYVKEGNDDHRITVRLGNSTLAQADASIRWQIKLDAAPDLYQNYKTMDNIRNNLVERNLQVALNTAFSQFNPLDPKNLDHNPLPDLSAAAFKQVHDEVATQVDIIDVQVPTIQFDDDTEKKIGQINQQRAQTSIADEQYKTNVSQAKANDALKQSVTNDPNVIVQNCINATVAKGISPFGCWPGSGAQPVVPVK